MRAALSRRFLIHRVWRNLQLYEKAMAQNTTIFLDSADPIVRLFFQGPGSPEKKK